MCALPPKTRLQIAAEYGMSRNTLRRKLEKARFRLPPGDLMPNAQKSIYEYLGYPPDVN